MSFFNPREYYPIIRRWAAEIAELFRIPHEQRRSSWVMTWCNIQFGRDAALKHYLRIERRLGRAKMVLVGKFSLTEANPQLGRTMPGSILFPRLFRRRR